MQMYFELTPDVREGSEKTMRITYNVDSHPYAICLGDATCKVSLEYAISNTKPPMWVNLVTECSYRHAFMPNM